MDILEQWVSDFLLLWVLPILLYSGAMLPLGVALLLHKKMEERRRKHQRLFFILFWVQAASFLPFILALLLRVPHAIHGLIWPVLIGTVLFLWGSLYLASECFEVLRAKLGPQVADPSAGPTTGKGKRFWRNEKDEMRLFLFRWHVRKEIPILTLGSGLFGLLLAVLLWLVLWRTLWLAHHGIRFIDWSPFPEWLNTVLSWWVPLSLLICPASVYFAKERRRSPALIVGCYLHAISTIGLIGLALWVYTAPLEGGSDGIWWMEWLARRV